MFCVFWMLYNVQMSFPAASPSQKCFSFCCYGKGTDSWITNCTRIKWNALSEMLWSKLLTCVVVFACWIPIRVILVLLFLSAHCVQNINFQKVVDPTNEFENIYHMCAVKNLQWKNTQCCDIDISLFLKNGFCTPQNKIGISLYRLPAW